MRLVLLVALLSACNVNSHDGLDERVRAARQIQPELADLATGKWILRLRAGHTPSKLGPVEEALASLNVKHVNPLMKGAHEGRIDRFGRTWTFFTETPAPQVMESLNLAEVEFVEPDYRAQALGMPNDPYRSFQWNLDDIDVESAWSITDGSGVVVAVVDTGVSLGGEDTPVSVLQGYDFVDNDTNPNDGDGHGTHVAGTIAQATNNGVGVAGVAPGATILPVRVLDDSGNGDSSDIAAGIVWAVDQGAEVINLSLGSDYLSTVEEDACQYASDNGVLVVGASGNSATTDWVVYPAAFDTVIAVGATDFNRETTEYSNWGPEVELVAPGGDVYADENNDGYVDGVVQETNASGYFDYEFWEGTSMAAPHVAATAALLIASGVTDHDEVRTRLQSTATDLGKSGWDKKYGFGLVNPYGALTAGSAADIEPGDLYITEVMVNPKVCKDSIGEWFELYNATDDAINLQGLLLSNKKNQVTLGEYWLGAGEFAVLGRGPNGKWGDPDVTPDDT
ncbi:MAG: S8 family serine peptidase, partial [Proteobacteria bacterium]|nr:S8 family serine peptidase [Pseudomonadota bacterium]